MDNMIIAKPLREFLKKKKWNWFDLIKLKNEYREMFDDSARDIKGIARFLEFIKEEGLIKG